MKDLVKTVQSLNRSHDKARVRKEGHLLLATLAQRVSFSLVPGQTIEPDLAHHLAMRPAGAVHVLVKKK